MNNFSFSIEQRSKEFPLARTGVISTPHGEIRTPAFIPVGTRATIKGVLPEHMEAIGAQALLANAYHLNLRPGTETLDLAGGETDGGLARFMNWKRAGKFAPTFTDSGGFQVMSLGVGFKKVIAMTEEAVEKERQSGAKEKLAFIDDDGVQFKSHLDGSMMRFNPEVSMEVQHKIGADIMFAFDELTTLLHSREYQEESLERRTHPWAARCLRAHKQLTELRSQKPYQALFGVLQGANYEDLRRLTARTLAEMDEDGQQFDGFGIGGALQKEILGDIVGWCTSELNSAGAESKPRHLLGISGIADILDGVAHGVDTFDCVSPSREARNGALYTKFGRFNIKRAEHKNDFSPIEADCECYTCQNYTRAYLHHLQRTGELIGNTLNTIHNEHFILRLVDRAREAIENENFTQYRAEVLANFQSKGGR